MTCVAEVALLEPIHSQRSTPVWNQVQRLSTADPVTDNDHTDNGTDHTDTGNRHRRRDQQPWEHATCR